MNSLTVKEIFPLVKNNMLWYGPSISSGDREFMIPEGYPIEASGWRIDEQGNKFIRVKGVRWYTNLDHGRRHEPMKLMSEKDNLRFSKHKEFKEVGYRRYDNYDAIDVPYSDVIPSDYAGIMGVPISFMDKYCPEQFEILGLTQIGCHDEVPDTQRYNDYKEVLRETDKLTGSSGGKTNENAVIIGKGKKKTYYLGPNGEIVHSEYKIIIIRKKQ